MKTAMIALGALMLSSACMTPPAVAPAGAVPFSQVLRDTAGRPFECTDYDAVTDSCTAIGTYRDLGGGTFQFTGDLILDPSIPPVRITGTAEERGGVICADYANVAVSSVSGLEDFPQAIVFSQVEAIMATLGEVCGSYLPSGSGYIVRAVSGPALVTAQPDETVQFFAQPKSLRFAP